MRNPLISYIIVISIMLSIVILTPIEGVPKVGRFKTPLPAVNTPQYKEPFNVWNNVIVRVDDGPDIYTSELVKTLKELGVKNAIFGLIGRNIKNYPDTLPEILNAGYTIANHTYTHPRMHLKRVRAYYIRNPEQWRWQIAKTNDTIKEILRSKGISYQCKVFCCPEVPNYLPPLLDEIVREQGLVPDKGWDIDSCDSVRNRKRLNAEEIAYRIDKLSNKNCKIKILIHSRKGRWSDELKEIDKILSNSKEIIARRLNNVKREPI